MYEVTPTAQQRDLKGRRVPKDALLIEGTITCQKDHGRLWDIVRLGVKARKKAKLEGKSSRECDDAGLNAVRDGIKALKQKEAFESQESDATSV